MKDILEEVQEDVLPPNKMIQETENCYTSAQRTTRKSSPSTEEEIDQILNQQLTSEVFYRTQNPSHSFPEFHCTDPESSSVNQGEGKPNDNPTCLVGSITYIHDFIISDLPDDDVF